MEYAIMCTLDALGTRKGSGSSYFGLSLSVGIVPGPGALPIDETLLCPWNWSLDGVKILTDSGQGFSVPAGAQVQLIDVHAQPLPVPGTDADYDRLLVEMNRKWDEAKGTTARFLLSPPLDEQDAEPNTPAVQGERPWPVFLANASSQPYPYAQWLNLAAHFKVDWGGASPSGSTPVVVAPELTIRASGTHPSFKLSLAVPPSPIQPMQGTGEVVWQYAQPAIPIAARCGAVNVEPRKFGVVNGESLWVDMSGSDGVFGHEWRAELERAAPDVFDLADLVMDAYEGLIADPAKEVVARQWSADVRSMVLAALSDRLSGGHLPGPSGAQSLLGWLSGVLPSYASGFAAIGSALSGAPAMTLEAWKAVLRAALVASGMQDKDFVSLRAQNDPRVTVQSPKEMIEELRKLHATFREPKVMVRALTERWRLVYPQVPTGLIDAVIDVGSATATDPQTSANTGVTMRRLLDVAEAAPAWARWLDALKLNDGSRAQRGALRRSLPQLLRRAIYDRFGGVVPAGVGVAPISELRVLNPRVGAFSDDLSQWLDAEVGGLGAREAPQLIPDEGATPVPNAPLKTAEKIPHPLAVEVGLVQPFVGSTTPAEDRSDALRHFSGFGILMRRAGGAGPWRCLNLAAAGDIVAGRNSANEASSRLTIDRWGSRPLVVPLRIGYHDGLSEATVSYDNRPLAALSADGLLGDHGLRDPNDSEDDKPPLRYLYIPPDEFPVKWLDREWSHLEALAFGRTYQLAMFLTSNSGALPAELAATVDTPGRLHAKPGDLGPVPQSAIRDASYPRRVAVGQPRLSLGAIDSQAKTIVTPSIGGVVPRVRELFGESVVSSGPEGAFLLLAPPGHPDSSLDNRWSFEARRPSTDIQTWLRWQLDSALTKDDLVKIIAEYYTRMAANHEDQANAKPLMIDDPCVARMVGALLRYDPKTDTWLKKATFEWTPTVDPTGLVPAGFTKDARTSSGPLKIAVQSASTGSETITSSADGNTRTVRVLEGEIYRLVLANEIDGSKRFDDTYGVGWPDPEVSEHFAGKAIMSPWTLWIEVATTRWTAEPSGTVDSMLAEVHGALSATFTGGVPDPDGRIRQAGKLTVAADLDLIKYPFIHMCELEHQRWAWQGRPARIDFLGNLARVDWQSGFVPVMDAAQWEGAEFGSRDDDDVSLHRMDSELRADASTKAKADADAASRRALRRKASQRRWHYDLDFSGDRAASYHRFAMRITHRYAAMFPELRPEIANAMVLDPVDKKKKYWRWHSFFVPCRPIEAPARPVVRVILPLTARADDKDSVERSPGLLVVVKGAGFDNGGLAEEFRVQGVLAERGTRKLFEIAPDPRDDGNALKVDATSTAMADIKLHGPIGHSFDPDGVSRRMVTATYLVEPPSLGSDLTGHFLKLRFARSYSPMLTVPTVGKAGGHGDVDQWSEGHWTQLLANSRIVSNGIQVSTLTLEREDQEFLTKRDTVSISPTIPGEKRPVQALLAVTRKITDAANKAGEAEQWVGLYRETTPGRWAWLGDKVDKAPVTMTIGPGTYYGRFIFVLRGYRDRTGPESQNAIDFSKVTESDAWDRLFEAEQRRKDPGNPVRLNEEVRDRIQIATITLRFGGPKAQPQPLRPEPVRRTAKVLR